MTSRNKLLIRVIADKEMWADTRKMKNHLNPAVDLLRKTVISVNITTQQFEMKYDSDMGSLTVTAESAILDQIAGLLQEAGSSYFACSTSQVKAALFYSSSTAQYTFYCVTPSLP